jgi:hypothetical protein
MTSDEKASAIAQINWDADAQVLATQGSPSVQQELESFRLVINWLITQQNLLSAAQADAVIGPIVAISGQVATIRANQAAAIAALG